jgi:hypothetical protein
MSFFEEPFLPKPTRPSPTTDAGDAVVDALLRRLAGDSIATLEYSGMTALGAMPEMTMCGGREGGGAVAGGAPPPDGTAASM